MTSIFRVISAYREKMYSSRRKAELFDSGTFSIVAFDE